MTTITLQNKSLNDIRKEFPDCFYYQSWYEKESFANEKITGTWDVSLEPVKDSFNKTWDEQQKLLKDGDEVPPVAVLMYAMCKHFKETGERAFENVYVRTSSRTADGYLVDVGDFDAEGADVNGNEPGHSDDDLGVSFSRSESCALNPEPLSSGEAFSLDRALTIVKDAGYEVSKLTLAKKFQQFRAKRGNGSGDDYWQGLEEIAKKHFSV